MTLRPDGRSLEGTDDVSALSALPPRDTSALVRAVRDRLRDAIIFEEIPAGVRLNQVQVAEQLGVSRMPVRAASAELVNEGLLEPIATGGVTVRRLTREDIVHAYEVRESLEAGAGRIGAMRRPIECAQRLEDVIRRHDELGPDPGIASLLKLDREFHAALLESTGNPYFTRAMVPMWSVVERAMVGLMVKIPDMITIAWQQHRAIARSVREGSVNLVEAHIREHLSDAAERLSASADAEQQVPPTR